MSRPDEPADEPTRLEDATDRCQRFERLWRRGDRPRLEDYLSGFDGDDGPLLERLLRLEWALREADGDAAEVGPYLDRFAGRADAVRSAWEQWQRRAPHPADLTRAADAPEGDAPVPTSLGRYVDLEVIGQGGMGVVFKGFDTRLKRRVAIKMVGSGLLSPQWLARFRTEAEALARVQHPHIVQVYDHDEHDGRPYLVMEYVSGGSLEDRLHKGPLAAREAARLVALLARAVQHAHAAGVVHRDLKPANVLLAPALEGDPGTAAGGRPKVGDFGLARMAENDGPEPTGPPPGGERGDTATGLVMGTPAYVAPEQAAGRTREVGPPVDVWALGVILYRCLSGHLPFDADTQTTMLAAVQQREPTPLARRRDGIPPTLQDLCFRCLRKEPDRRPSVRDLAEALEAFARSAPSAAAAPTPPVAAAVPVAPLPAVPPPPSDPPRRKRGELQGAVLIDSGPDLPMPNSPSRPVPMESDEAPRRCPGCGGSVSPSWPRCRECGTRLVDVRRAEDPAPPYRRPRDEDERDYRRRDYDDGYDRPPASGYQRPRRDATNLVLGVVAAVSAFAVLLPFGSLAPLGFGIVGWILNAEELSRVKRRSRDRADRLFPRIGTWCGVGATAAGVLGTGYWVLMAVFSSW